MELKDRTLSMQRLSKVQQELKAPKDQYNSFGKYAYRSCEDILEALKPLLNENGLTIFFEDEVQELGECLFLKTTLHVRDAETNQELLTSSAYAGHEKSKRGMDLSQITGAASSYARKYALNGVFLIDDTKDADAQKPAENGKKTATKAKPNRFARLGELTKQAVAVGVKKEGISEWFEANYGHALKEATDAEIKEAEQHVTELIASMKGMKNEHQ